MRSSEHAIGLDENLLLFDSNFVFSKKRLAFPKVSFKPFIVRQTLNHFGIFMERVATKTKVVASKLKQL